MKKRIFAILAVVAVAAVCLLSMTGCKADVEDRVYEYDSVKVFKLTDQGKAEMEKLGMDEDEFAEYLLDMTTAKSNSYYFSGVEVFENGQLQGVYEVDGQVVWMDGQYYGIARGDKFTREYEAGDYGTIQVAYLAEEKS